MPWLLGGIQTNELPESILHFAPKARQGMYKVSVDGAPTLRPPESVWLDNLSILTPYRNIREVSCWKILNGSFDRMLFLRSLQRSMTKIQTLECIGAFDLVSFSLTMCVFELIRASGALQKKKIISVRQFQPPCFWCNGTRTQNQSMAQWLGWFRIHWLEYIIPETAFRRQWRHISIEKKNPNSIQQLGERLKYKTKHIAVYLACSWPRLGFFFGIEWSWERQYSLGGLNQRIKLLRSNQNQVRARDNEKQNNKGEREIFFWRGRGGGALPPPPWQLEEYGE